MQAKSNFLHIVILLSSLSLSFEYDFSVRNIFFLELFYFISNLLLSFNKDRTEIAKQKKVDCLLLLATPPSFCFKFNSLKLNLFDLKNAITNCLQLRNFTRFNI